MIFDGFHRDKDNFHPFGTDKFGKDLVVDASTAHELDLRNKYLEKENKKLTIENQKLKQMIKDDYRTIDDLMSYVSNKLKRNE